VALNPLDTTTMSHIGLMLSGARGVGAWRRDDRARHRSQSTCSRLGPHVAGVESLSEGEFEQALVRATRAGLMQFVNAHCLAAAAARQLGRAGRCPHPARRSREFLELNRVRANRGRENRALG